MRITWVTRSFLDYRIPVYKELNRLCGNQLTLIYYRDVVPERVQHKIETVLGARAIALTGEWRLSGKQSSPISDLKRKGVRIPFQPGLLRTLKDSAPDVMISDGFFNGAMLHYLGASGKRFRMSCAMNRRLIPNAMPSGIVLSIEDSLQSGLMRCVAMDCCAKSMLFRWESLLKKFF